MKPYHLIDRWVDLDAVLSVGDIKEHGYGLEFSVTLAFRDSPLTFMSRIWNSELAKGIPNDPKETYYDRMGEAADKQLREAYESFLAAWKRKNISSIGILEALANKS